MDCLRRSRWKIYGVVFLLSVVSGISIALLAQHLNKLTLFGGMFLIFVLPLTFRVLLVLPFKIFRLLKQLSWWHGLWLMAYVSGLTFRIRGVSDIQQSPLDIAALFRLLLVGGVGVILVGYFALGRGTRLGDFFKGLIGLLTTYVLVSLLSTVWSVYPAWTLYKATEYLITLALLVVVMGRTQTFSQVKVLFDWTWLLNACVLLSVWLGVLLWPEQAILRDVGLLKAQIVGVIPRVAANGVGQLAALVGIVAFVRLFYTWGDSRRIYFLVFVIATATLVLSQSRSPLTGFLLAISLVLFFDGRISVIMLGGLSVLWGISFTRFGETFWHFFQRGQSESVFLSLSGRALYWQAALNLIKKNPLLGFGAYAGGRFLIAEKFSSTLSSLHGTWVEVMVGTGLLGLIPLLGAIVGTWKVLMTPIFSCQEPLHHQLRLEAIGVMALLSVRSIFSVTFIWHPALTWLLILGFAEFLRRQRANYASS